MEQQTWTVKRILEWTSGFLERKSVDSPRLSAELLLAHVLKVPRIKLYTDYERPLIESELASFREFVRRAGEHEPIAYLTGQAHFFDLELDVRPGVLIPRADTETLVESTLNFCRHTPGMESPRILDLCTGSGCIAAAVAKHLPAATVVAVDIDPLAVEVAKANLARLKLDSRVSLLQGDLYEPLTSLVDCAPFHLVLSNPPYIRTGDIASLDRNVRNFEPRLALDGGPDGLALHRRILAGVPQRLLPGGKVMLEIAYDQGKAALNMASEYHALANAKILKDAAGNDRILSLSLAVA
jgi:release factor glutamine methyltransferase